VATVGRRGIKKTVSRKAIQEVQIRKACRKIIHPGAPLALRLSSNLLYGVSKVYAEQCRFVLDDAEKVQEAMRLLYRELASRGTVSDPKAGKPVSYVCIHYLNIGG
jgi:meiotic recombination protein REC8, fungi type